MARAIVRFSLHKDTSSKARKKVENSLRMAGMKRTSTGTWETDERPLAAVFIAIRSAMTVLEKPAGSAKLAHLWVYVDQEK